MKLACIFGIIFASQVLMMAVTKPLLAEFGINHRSESCEEKLTKNDILLYFEMKTR